MSVKILDLLRGDTKDARRTCRLTLTPHFLLHMYEITLCDIYVNAMELSLWFLDVFRIYRK